MSDPSVTAPETQYATIVEVLCADPPVENATARPGAPKRLVGQIAHAPPGGVGETERSAVRQRLCEEAGERT